MPPRTEPDWKDSDLARLWSLLKFIVKCVLVGIVGGTIGAVVSGVATFYCYCIGTMIGLPLGVVLGIWRYWRLALRDAVLLAAGCFGLAAIVWQIGMRLGWVPTLREVATAFATIPGTLLGHAASRVLSPVVRYYAAYLIGLGAVSAWIWWIMAPA